MGDVDSLIKRVVLVILEQISGWCAGQYRGDGALFIKLFLNTRAKLILFKARKRIQVSGHMSVFFLLQQICTTQNHKYQFFLSIFLIFLEYFSHILIKRAKESSLTL